ncbi:hypothetical protein GCM10009535_26100 [Streptomyces thermocarboxydovorans]|uniref:Uncharacterized protein n=2 Tax=Streptomyces thermocarboxydovorans TaxID=59298 RepID=A0ABP3SRX0_9ACTN
MRAIAEQLEAYAEGLEGAWCVEIGPSGPVLAMRHPAKRHEGTVRRICKQLDERRADRPGHPAPVTSDAVCHDVLRG